jgi:glycosyltransferase involved in cell wall biosynthesis
MLTRPASIPKLHNPLVHDNNGLTVLILTFNEERHIARCIQSAQQITTNIFIIDSFSTDDTVGIAEYFGAIVWKNKFFNHAAQLTWAMDNLPIQTEWVMRIDADEVVSLELASCISGNLSYIDSDVNGLIIRRRVCFNGQVINFGGISHWVLRVWRRDFARVEQRWMDEHMVLISGRALKIKGDFFDDNLNSISWWTDKHNIYSTREAIDILRSKYFPSVEGCQGLTSQAWLRRIVKKYVYFFYPLVFEHSYTFSIDYFSHLEF